MLKMMSDFKADILANVKESVAQVYQDFGYTDDANSNEDQQPQDPISMILGEAEQGASIIDQVINFTQNKETKPVQESSEKSNSESFATQFATGEKQDHLLTRS